MEDKPKYINRVCKTHGDTGFVLEGRGYYRCKQCRMDRVAEQRRKNKLKLIEEYGGKCHLCGYNRCVRALHFHHLDPSTKSFGIAYKGKTKGLQYLREEADKCILLCANCHMEIEAGITSIAT